MNAVVERIEQPRAVQATQAQVTPSQILQLAMDKGVDLDRLEKLYALQQQWEADQAKKAYTAAMAEFKRNPPEILKDKHVEYETSKGVTAYDHATLGGACKAAIPALAAVGISHDWELEQPDIKTVRVTCVLTHSSGHSTRKTLQAHHDESGGKNAIQALGSAVKYLERYTFMAAIGLADMEDDDGAATGNRTDQKEKPAPPDGYEAWKADMTAKADEGKAAHLDAWKRSDEPFRIYACTHDRPWWEASKKQAAKAGA